MPSTLLDCPDCKYQYSPSALSCLNCGRIFRVSQHVFTGARTTPATWLAAFLTASLIVFSAIILIPNANRTTAELVAAENGSEASADRAEIENRRQFALDRQGMTVENPNKNLNDMIYTTEDYLEPSDTLVVTNSTLTKKECDLLANKDGGQAAASLGFNRMICRNRRLRSEWSLPLEKTNF